VGVDVDHEALDPVRALGLRVEPVEDVGMVGQPDLQGAPVAVVDVVAERDEHVRGVGGAAHGDAAVELSRHFGRADGAAHEGLGAVDVGDGGDRDESDLGFGHGGFLSVC